MTEFDAFAARLPQAGSKNRRKSKAFAAFDAFDGSRAYARDTHARAPSRAGCLGANSPRARIEGSQMRQMRQINDKSNGYESPHASNHRQKRQNVQIHPDGLLFAIWLYGTAVAWVWLCAGLLGGMQ